MPSAASVRDVSSLPSATAMPTSALMKLFRMECVRYVVPVSPQAATTLPRVTIMNADEPTESMTALSAATRGADHPSSSIDAAVSHARAGNSFVGVPTLAYDRQPSAPNRAALDQTEVAIRRESKSPRFVAVFEQLHLLDCNAEHNVGLTR